MWCLFKILNVLSSRLFTYKIYLKNCLSRSYDTPLFPITKYLDISSILFFGNNQESNFQIISEKIHTWASEIDLKLSAPST